MSRTSDRPDLTPLPQPQTSEGKTRRVGIEVEFSGITEEDCARILAQELDGAAGSNRPNHWQVSGSRLGSFECYLDSRPVEKLDTRGIGAHLRDLARSVVPVEIVSDPITPAEIPALDDALEALADAGATGTAGNLFLGFGTHFNPEVVSTAFKDVAPVLTAYALLEDHIRREADIDMSRRMMTWVDPFPRALVDRLAATDAPGDMRALIDCYLQHSPSRNRGLDMLCLFAHVDRPRVAAKMDMEMISARPTYHLRLPDCRIDESDWSLSKEWNRWVLVEQVAARPDLLARLCTAWRDHRASLTTLKSDWAHRVHDMLEGAGL
ncbi:hypothetical protein GCM10011415_28650 [Salipiger pallidus]|uniref:Amidoligase enzyme n=1 Tax=Salipiger pallidus TaxID=1775170 RepID=A0A8J2ZLQ7_9RHOB|nr:amidoligase family protein [Salipiger pallidus]GGG77976.1 hypothetical protein GCM10011415_28650 [Salipiger pallidus]